MSDELLQRLRSLLAPRYEVDHHLGQGGMGVVYAGRHVLLDKRVAIKVLKPDLGTALGIERFLREPRMLAKLSHPNVVHVYDTSDHRSELLYYVLEHLEGETLEARLGRGRISIPEAAAIGRDVLAGLQHAHERGIVHRDVKPSNIFLVGGRAVLTDFGVAKSLSDPGLTSPGHAAGTLLYMAPEVARGEEASPRSDLYALAVVLYQATSESPGEVPVPPFEVEAGRPNWFAGALRRALESGPENRWPDAASFARALWVPRVPPRVQRGLAASGGVGLAALLYFGRCVVFGLGCPPPPTAPLVRIDVREAGLASSRSPLADSLACAVADELDAYVDVRAGCPGERRRGRGPITALEGSVTQRAGSLFVELRGMGAPIVAATPRQEWYRLVGPLADEIYASILVDSLEPLLPRAILPKHPEGLSAFVAAERLVKEARWGAAYDGFGSTLVVDSTCWMCSWRRAEVGRWLGRLRNPDDVARYEAYADSFPDYYRRLIRAQGLPVPARLDSLEALTRQWPDFLFGHFAFGDELLHRGPLAGHARREARSPFEQAARIQPAFAPAWEHLAMLWIAEGDSAAATHALARFRALSPPTDAVSAGIRALLEIAFAWRFLREQDALLVTQQALRLARQAGAPVDAGPRFLLYYNTPRGALALADELVSDPGAERSALVARLLAHLVLGQPESARTVAGRLRDRFPEPRLGLFAQQLDAMLAITAVPQVPSGRAWSDIEQALSEYTILRSASADVQRRAAWTLALHAVRIGDEGAAQRYRAFLRAEPAPRPLTRLLRAAALAEAGRHAAAISLSDTLTTLLARDLPDPFLRSVLHLFRAEWHERSGGLEAARRELLWHENEDRGGYPVGDPQPEEIDAAFGVEARWRAARLLDRADGSRGERCRAYAAVARLWATGDSVHVARADSARIRRTELRCEGRS